MNKLHPVLKKALLALVGFFLVFWIYFYLKNGVLFHQNVFKGPLILLYVTLSPLRDLWLSVIAIVLYERLKTPQIRHLETPFYLIVPAALFLVVIYAL